MPSPLIDTVATLLAGIAADVVMPRFRQLAASDVSEKSPGEIVTVVDRAVEAALIPALTALRSGSRVVGEEGVSENPDLLHGLDRGEVWVVDPIDGTTNFVHGREDFGIMVALLRDGQLVWMMQRRDIETRDEVLALLRGPALGAVGGRARDGERVGAARGLGHGPVREGQVARLGRHGHAHGLARRAARARPRAGAVPCRWAPRTHPRDSARFRRMS